MDPHLKKFPGGWTKNVLQRLGMADNEAIQSRMVTRRLRTAQKKIIQGLGREFEAESAEAWFDARKECSVNWLTRYFRRWLWAGLAVLLVTAIAALVVSMTLLNEAWLKEQLVTQAREMFDIELEIGSLEFHPWQGEADLYEVTFSVQKPNRRLQGKIKSIHTKLAIWALLFREVDVENLRVTKPHVTFILDRSPEPRQRATLDQVAEKVIEVAGNLLVRMIEAILESFRPKQGYDVRIGQLEVVDGQLDCTINRPGVDPVEVAFDNLDYAASDLRPGQRGFGMWGYIAHADMSADLKIGDAKIGLEHRFASMPRIIRIVGLDLKEVDRLGSQKDAIVLKKGTLDFLYRDSPDRFEVDSRFTGMQLAKNEEADLPGFLFVPVDHLIKHVEKNGGNLTLQFARERGGARVSDDMEFIIAEVWKGMWHEILKRFQNEAGEELKDWKAKGTEKLRGFLRNKDLLKDQPDEP